MIDRLIQQIIARRIPLWSGLIPCWNMCPHVVNNYGGQQLDLEGAANAIYEFNKAIWMLYTSTFRLLKYR